MHSSRQPKASFLATDSHPRTFPGDAAPPPSNAWLGAPHPAKIHFGNEGISPGRRTRRLLLRTASVFGVLVLAGGVAAQPEPVGEPPAADRAEQRETGDVPPEAVAPPSPERTWSASEMRSTGAQYVEQIRERYGSVQELFARAKDEKDVVKTLCLDDKLSQVSAAVDMANARHGTLEEALENSSMDRAKHEFTLLGVLKDRVDTLTVEADQCVGEDLELTEEEESTLGLLIDEPLPETNPDYIELAPALLTPPAVKSPVD